MANFNIDEIPYDTLEKFGLNKEMVDDLPQKVIDEVLEGYPSPVLPLKVVLDSGETSHARARISLHRKQDGKVEIGFHPCFKEIYSKEKEFTPEEKQSLLKGNTLIKKDKQDGAIYVQADPFTRTIISCPVGLLDRNLSFSEDSLHLTLSEIQALRKGERVSIMDKTNTYTLGIDLSIPEGVRLEKGDEKKWLLARDTPRDLSEYNFGLNGCWKKNSSGYLDYIEEDNYTEQMWDVMRESFHRGYSR